MGKSVPKWSSCWVRNCIPTMLTESRTIVRVWASCLCGLQEVGCPRFESCAFVSRCDFSIEPKSRTWNVRRRPHVKCASPSWCDFDKFSFRWAPPPHSTSHPRTSFYSLEVSLNRQKSFYLTFDRLFGEGFL